MFRIIYTARFNSCTLPLFRSAFFFSLCPLFLANHIFTVILLPLSYKKISQLFINLYGKFLLLFLVTHWNEKKVTNKSKINQLNLILYYVGSMKVKIFTIYFYHFTFIVQVYLAKKKFFSRES